MFPYPNFVRRYLHQYYTFVWLNILTYQITSASNHYLRVDGNEHLISTNNIKDGRLVSDSNKSSCGQPTSK